MSRSAILSTAIVMVTILAGSASSEDPGSRPMNVAVSPNGNVILATSMGSTKVTQVKLSGLSYVISYIEVDEPSWGITFVTSNVVVVTHPGATILSVLTRPKLSGSFSKDRDVEIGDQGRYATEVIAKPGTLTEGILLALAAHGTQPMTAHQVAGIVGRDAKLVGIYLAQLARQGRIARVGRGEYGP